MKSTDILRGWLFSPAQKSPHIFLAVHSAFMWLSHTVAQWNLLKELPTHQIFHELGPDTSMRGKTMSETRPAMAFCLVCVTVILPAALLHSTSYFSDHQKAPWILSVIAGAQTASVFSQPLAPSGSGLDLESFLCVFVLFCCYFYEWLSRRTLTPAQSYPAIHKKQRENIVLCPVGNCLWYWPRLSRILVIQDLCYRSASYRELPGRACLLPARFPLDLGSGVQCMLRFLPSTEAAQLRKLKSRAQPLRRHWGHAPPACGEPCPLVPGWGLRLVAAQSLQVLVFRDVASPASAWLSAGAIWMNTGWTNPARSSPERIAAPARLGHPRADELQRTGIMRNFPSTPFHFFNCCGCDACGNFLTRYRYKRLNSPSFVFAQLRDLFRASKETPPIQESVATACSTSWKERESVSVMEKPGTIKKPRTRDFKEVLWSKIEL